VRVCRTADWVAAWSGKQRGRHQQAGLRPLRPERHAVACASERAREIDAASLSAAIDGDAIVLARHAMTCRGTGSEAMAVLPTP
jgi:hypothetical protein